MRRNIANWAMRPLNLSNRVSLIKAILQEMLIYLFMLWQCQKPFLNISKAFNDNSYGGNPDKQKWDLISWDKVCRPKYQEGLGIRDLEKNNEFMGDKIWRNWVTHKEET